MQCILRLMGSPDLWPEVKSGLPRLLVVSVMRFLFLSIFVYAKIDKLPTMVPRSHISITCACQTANGCWQLQNDMIIGTVFSR